MRSLNGKKSVEQTEAGVREATYEHRGVGGMSVGSQVGLLILLRYATVLKLSVSQLCLFIVAK